LRQEDIDARRIDAKVTVKAERPRGDPAVSSDDVTARRTAGTPLAAKPKLNLTKEPDLSGVSVPAVAGQLVTYTFTVANTGNTTVSDIAITDSRLSVPPDFATWPGEAGILLPGQAVSARGTHLLLESDIRSGVLTSSARADGERPGGDPDNLDDDVEAATELAVPLRATGALSLVVAALPSNPGFFALSGAMAGPVSRHPGSQMAVGRMAAIVYSATNTGNVPLMEVQLAQTGFTGAGRAPSIAVVRWPDPASPGVLAPGQEARAISAYTVVQDDVDAGVLEATGSAVGHTVDGTGVGPVDGMARWTSTRLSGLAVTVEEDSSGSGRPGVAGEAVEYTFAVVNTGNTTVTDITLTDPALDFPPRFAAWPDRARPGDLEPGETARAKGSRAVRQVDLDAGGVWCSPRVSGEAPGGDPGDPADDVAGATWADTALEGESALQARVIADFTGLSQPPAPGDRLPFSVEVVNTGTTTLFHASVANRQLADGISGRDEDDPYRLMVGSWPDPGAVGVLRPDEAVGAAGDLTVTEQDIARGTATIDIVAVSKAPRGDWANPSDQVIGVAGADIPLAGGAELQVTGEAGAPRRGDPLLAGYVAVHRFTVANTGNVTVRDIALIAPRHAAAPRFVRWPGPAGTLAPGQRAIALGLRPLDGDDLAGAGTVQTVTVKGKRPGAQAGSEHQRVRSDGSFRALTVGPSLSGRPRQGGAGERRVRGRLPVCWAVALPGPWSGAGGGFSRELRTD
jgi:hypothetical protein